jgi:hypothetical protein
MNQRMTKAISLLVVALCWAISSKAGAQTFSTPENVTTASTAEAAATNGTGTTAVAFNGATFTVRAGGHWSTPVRLSAETNLEANVAVAPNGDVLAVWSFRTTNTYVPNEAQAAFYAGGHWGDVITISRNVYGNVYSRGLPSIGFDGSSQATLVWEEIATQSPLGCALKAVTGNSASGFGSARTISTASTCFGWTRLSVNANGQALAVEGVPGILSGAVISIARSASGAWSAPVTVAPSGVYRQRQPKVGLAGDGSAVLLWLTNGSVRYAVLSAGTWSAPATLPVLVGGAGGVADLAVDNAGDAVALFTQTGIGPGGYATYRPAGATSGWQAKVSLPSGSALEVVATPAGTFSIGGQTVSTRLAGGTSFSSFTFANASTTLLAAGSGTIAAILEGTPNNVLQFSSAPVP